ncbi:UDP-glucoronosyl and UDP-glucosyl transferase [Plectosphaerella plurivora]|uniref:UDP-glucoronosyl and UDP-glucosyl transferase n=1 Tax=Plectosphaerella plurivora TaxID=936078 RepID=A0A9P8V4X6_9PEZI|nr:UDP-glucoronosyl and UDP-glucosyl transferase [Plectosphaerella plurivora]
MADPKRILFMTCSERGQSNVFIAVIQELGLIDPSVDLHLCSFSPLAKTAAALDRPPVFHELTEPPVVDILFNSLESGFPQQAALHPTVWNAHRGSNVVSRVGCPWTPEQMSRLVRQMQAIIKDVQPDLIVIDNLFAPAITVCVAQKEIQWIILSPNSYREFITSFQPKLAVFWKYAVPRAIIPYPVPWYLILSNIYQLFLYIVTPPLSKWFRAHAKNMRENHGIEFADISYIPQMLNPHPGFKVLCPSLPETDFPFDIYPPHVQGCGPIVLPAPPVSEVDPELASWLAKRPTILVALGTHAAYTDDEAAELGGSLRRVLAEARRLGKDLQVLWKLKRVETGEAGLAKIHASIGEEFLPLVRITSWLKPDPIAILQTGSIVCAVSHGGANSSWEALSAGVPQIILPTWYDTYDVAARMEYLGIGRIGSKKAAPRCTADELGAVFIDVIYGAAGDAIRERVKHLADVVRSAGEGRTIAAQAILAEVRGSKA